MDGTTSSLLITPSITCDQSPSNDSPTGPVWSIRKGFKEIERVRDCLILAENIAMSLYKGKRVGLRNGMAVLKRRAGCIPRGLPRRLASFTTSEDTQRLAAEFFTFPPYKLV